MKAKHTVRVGETEAIIIVESFALGFWNNPVPSFHRDLTHAVLSASRCSRSLSLAAQLPISPLPRLSISNQLTLATF